MGLSSPKPTLPSPENSQCKSSVFAQLFMNYHMLKHPWPESAIQGLQLMLRCWVSVKH